MIEYRVLGPLQVIRDRQPVTLGAAMWRRLLAVLLCRAGESVPVPVLIDALWGDQPPQGARKTLQVYVRRLRGALGHSARIVYADGYGVIAAPEQIDAFQFEDLVARGRAAWQGADLESARARFREALQLWRGRAYEDLDEISLVAGEAWRLEEQRLLTCEELVAVNLDRGDHAEVIADLYGMTNVLPYRERLCALLMLALYRAGRQVEALEIYRGVRTTLVQELGIEPGPVLRQAHEAVLRGDKSLDVSAREILHRTPWNGGGRHERTLGDGRVPAVPALLPADVSDFTGRNEQVSLLIDVLSGVPGSRAVPVSVVAGAAGVGKTTLAVHVAHRLRGAFPDGQLYVDLHGVGARPEDAREVLGRFLIALGWEGRALPGGVAERSDSFRTLVTDRRILMVLDDAAGEHQVRQLLPGSPTCAVLVTSRRRLAGLGAHTLHLEAFDPVSALGLFGQIAGLDRTSAEPASAAEIVELCGRLPLALRVAGARAAAREQWSLGYLADRLRDEQRRLDELALGDMSVRASLALSYDVLTDGAKRAFRLLGTLSAPTFPAWAAAALVDSTVAEADGHIDALLDGGLLVCDGLDGRGRPRYRFHDLVRLFARERAEAEEPADRQRAALTRAFGAWLALAEEADERIAERVAADTRGTAPRWRPESAAGPAAADAPETPDALAWFDGERTALTASVVQACEAGLDELAWELAAHAVNYYAAYGLYEDWSRTHEAALRACTQAGNRIGRAVMSRNLAWMRMTGIKTPSLAALDKTDEAHAAFREIGDQHGVVDVVSLRAFSHRHKGDFAKALVFGDRAMDLAERIRYQLGQARLWYLRAVIHREQGRYERAYECAHRCLSITTGTGNIHDRVLALWELAAACRRHDAYRHVTTRLQDAVDECHQRNERLLEAYLHLSLSDICIRLGRHHENGTHDRVTRALTVFQSHGVLIGQSVGLRLLGQLDDSCDRPREAVTYLKKAAGMANRLHNTYEHAYTLTALGHAYYHSGDRGTAESTWRRALRLYEQISNTAESTALIAVLRDGVDE